MEVVGEKLGGHRAGDNTPSVSQGKRAGTGNACSKEGPERVHATKKEGG